VNQAKLFQLQQGCQHLKEQKNSKGLFSWGH
jgi:hypothetical protein